MFYVQGRHYHQLWMLHLDNFAHMYLKGLQKTLKSLKLKKKTVLVNASKNICFV